MQSHTAARMPCNSHTSYQIMKMQLVDNNAHCTAG